MKRRTLLKSALTLPLVKPSANAGAISRSSMMDAENGAVFTGLPGLDYALGGIAPGEMVCISGPPCAGKTLVLLDLAARISSRYRQNVLFYSTHKPTAYLAKKAALKGGIEFRICEEGGTPRPGPAVYVLDSSTADTERAVEIAVKLQAEPAGSGTALIMDGWSTLPSPTHCIESIDGMAAYRAERWPHTLLSRQRIGPLRHLASMTRIPVVLGVSTESLMDDEALAASWDLESEIRRNADHCVKLHRPELFKVTADVLPEERNVVELTGTSPRWWDTRCSKLRFEARRLGFSTVV